MNRWDDRLDYAERKPIRAAIKVGLAVIVVIVCLGIVSSLLGWCNEAATVAQKELGATALLKKYEWFKNASAALDEKVATISIYDNRNKQMKADYGKMSTWPRDVREQYSIWQSELAGVKASYNILAADYNAQMSKINWAFCNVGSLPQGAEKVLPREYKPYILE